MILFPAPSINNKDNNVTLAPKWSRNNKISARSDRKRDQ
jgi:hypothetical protein